MSDIPDTPEALKALADRLEDFRKRRWMHWADSQDHALVWKVVAAVRQGAQQPVQAIHELEIIRRFMQRHTQSNVDRMSLEDLHAAVEPSQASTPTAGKVADPNAPAEVFLQLYGTDTPTIDPVDYTDGVSWCWHRIFESDVRYVQAGHAPEGGSHEPPRLKP